MARHAQALKASAQPGNTSLLLMFHRPKQVPWLYPSSTQQGKYSFTVGLEGERPPNILNSINDNCHYYSLTIVIH